MTCAMSPERLDAWLAGTLNDANAREVELHAAECPVCGPLLEAAGLPGRLTPEISPPPTLRDHTLRAVARRRRASNWRRVAVTATAIAAVALLMLIFRPTTKSARDFPGAGTELIAIAHARPEFAELDAAEHDVERALRDHPEDRGLSDALTRIRRQRDALRRLVVEAKS